MYFAVDEFGWDVSYAIDDVSITMVLLMMRQRMSTEGKTVMTLEDKERIDEMDWQTLVEESHRKVRNLKI